jgi:hypothetical protein
VGLVEPGGGRDQVRVARLVALLHREQGHGVVHPCRRPRCCTARDVLAPAGVVPGPGEALLAVAATAKGVNVLLGSATVQRIAGGGGSGSLVTLVVPSGSANQLAGLAAQGRIALVGNSAP